MSIRTVVLRGFGAGGSVKEVVERGFLPSGGVAPVAAFTANSLFGSNPLSVSFTDASTNTPTSWLWTFGDGSTSTLQNPTHTYAGAGTYAVSLTATNAGGSNTITKVNYITVTSKGDDDETIPSRGSGGAALWESIKAERRERDHERRLMRQRDLDVAMAIIIMEDEL